MHKKSPKIGTPFYKLHLDLCDRVRSRALIWAAVMRKVIDLRPLQGVTLLSLSGHLTILVHMATQACEKMKTFEQKLESRG